MPRPKQEQRDQIQHATRQALLQAAIQAFAAYGYDGASVDAISKDAGFAKGTIYNYFESKRALMLALIDEISTGHFDFIAARVRSSEDPKHRLQLFFQAGFTWVAEHPAQARILITTLNSADQAFKIEMYNAYEPMFRLMGMDILAPGFSAGIFREMDPQSTAGLLMATYLGTCSQVDEQGQPWINPDEVADFALHALQPEHDSAASEQ